MPKTYEIRCCNCNRYLGEGKIKEGHVTVLCNNCGTHNQIIAIPKDKVAFGERLKVEIKG